MIYLFPEVEDVLHVDDGSNLNFPAIPISLSSVIVFILLTIVFVFRYVLHKSEVLCKKRIKINQHVLNTHVCFLFRRHQGQSRQRIEEHIYAYDIPSALRGL